MVERQKPNACNSFGRGIFSFINLIVIGLGIATIVLLFVIKHSPTVAGWAFIALSLTSIVSGFFGFMTSDFRGCCGLHMIFMVLSTAGQVVAFLVIFLSETQILGDIGYEYYSSAYNLLRIVAILYVLLFACQMFLFFLNCVIDACCMLDFYEDLEQQPVNPAQAAKQEAKNEKARLKMEASSAKVLADKMKAKYGMYSGSTTYNQGT
eukprot:TRINITY_DN24154_c0_g1_i1.p1 TRINITY_DN24154_c0_g1~~TRINITY_DN24154_c0_g1_i1.p1  ORF type:complete len:208 (-),score=23.75 TRINITY_DN24154_c0_g1_i1:968-1591(-)